MAFPSSPSLEEIERIGIARAQETGGTLTFLGSLSEDTHGLPLHPLAKEYIKNYLQTKVMLAVYIFEQLDTHVFDNNLSHVVVLQWSSRLTSSSAYSKAFRDEYFGVDRIAIVLSTQVLTNAARLRDTLVHEVCHVAAFLFDDVIDRRHGHEWKFWVDGCRRVFPELPEVSVHHRYYYEYFCKCPTTKRTMKKIPARIRKCDVCREALTLKMH